MSSFKKTGDIKGNTESLIRNLKVIKYPAQTNFKILSSGNPEIYLPIIHYSLFNYSSLVAKFLSDKHYDMYAKNDLDFINTAFKCLMTLFNYKPEINTNQFFSNGYAEGKIILCKEIIDLVLQKDSELLKKKRSNNNKYSKDIYKNDNNNNSPRFHELNNSRNSYKKNNSINTNSNMSNNSNVNEDNNIENNNINDLNNINSNFNASLPMKSIPVPTPKPQFLIQKNNINYNNNQSSVQSFKPKTNNQMEIYDSSQDFPLGVQAYDSSVNNSNNNINNNNAVPNNCNNNSIDFNSIVKIITSLSESVSQMVNKIEKFKTNVEDRLNKVEAEIVIIKNKQNYLECKLNTNDNNNSNSELILNKNNLKINEINKYNINDNTDSYYNNLVNKKNSYNNNNMIKTNTNINNNNIGKNNQIFSSFPENITLNPDSNYEENNKIYYDQSLNKNIQQNYSSKGYTPPYEDNKVFNVFSYVQANDDNYNVNKNDVNNLQNDKNNIRKKYSDIDKIIENSEKSFFNTQKLLKDYENIDILKKQSNL